MTYGDIFTQMLLEAGAPERGISAILDHVKKIEPNTKLDQELTPSEAEALLKKLRQEIAGIRGWLQRCGFLVIPPEGTA